MIQGATEGRETAKEADERLRREMFADIIRWVEEAQKTGQFAELQLLAQFEEGRMVSYRGGILEKRR